MIDIPVNFFRMTRLSLREESLVEVGPGRELTFYSIEGDISEYCGLPGLIFLIRSQKALRFVAFPGVGPRSRGLYSRVDDTSESR